MNGLHIRNETHMAEWPANNAGLMQAKAFRRSHPEFKGRRIQQVLQMNPSEVPCGVILELS